MGGSRSADDAAIADSSLGAADALSFNRESADAESETISNDTVL